VPDEKLFFKVVRSAFSQRRKMVLNSLAANLDLPKRELELILNDAKIDPRRRPETLSIKEFSDLRLFVQTNPAFCCPSLVTEAMAQRIEEITGVPVVTITYDGTGSYKNDKIVPYLASLREPVSTVR